MSFEELSKDLSFDVLVFPKDMLNPNELIHVDHWGNVNIAATEITSGVQLQIITVPEGLLHVAICPHCGGRIEYLLDLRESFAKVPQTGRFDPNEIPDFIKAAATLRARVNVWAQEHRECKTTPKQYVIPEAVRDTARAIESTAREWIKEGKHVPPAIYVVARDTVLIVPDTRSEHPDTRDQETQLLLYLIREHMRRSGIEVLGVVCGAEAWGVMGEIESVDEVVRVGVRNHPKRKEVFFLSCLSSEYGELAVADIARENSETDDGPGTLGELRFCPINAPSGMIDGLLAVDFKMDTASKTQT